MSQNMKVRYKLRTDTAEGFNSATSLIPLEGEPIIVSNNKKKLKLGDGAKAAKDLPYLLDAVPVESGTGTNSVQLTNGVSKATAQGAIALGEGTKASKNNTVVLGAYNLEDSNTYALTVGNGTSNERTNALTVDKNGNLWFSGNIRLGGTGWDSADALELATKAYVDQNSGSKSYHIKTQDALETFQANGIAGNSATASYATAMGVSTSATAPAATAMGAYTTASANNAMAIGHTTTASGNSAFSWGKYTEASEAGAISGGYHPNQVSIFAKGKGSIAIGSAEGKGTITANGRGAVAMGLCDTQILAEGPGTISMGRDNYARGYGAVALGSYNTVVADNSVIAGVNSYCYAPRSYVEGSANYAGARGFYLVGVADTDDGLGLNFYFDSVQPETVVRAAVTNSLNITQYWPTSEIAQYIIYFSDSYSNLILEGLITTSQNYITVKYQSEEEKNAVLNSIPFDTIFDVKNITTFSGVMVNRIGYGQIVFGSEVHVEGAENCVWSSDTHIEGTRNIAVGSGCHVEGADNIGFGNNSHVEGQSNISRGNDSHVEGRYSESTGNASHAEGGFAWAQGDYSHAEGYRTHTTDLGAHAGGEGSIAAHRASFASGTYVSTGKESQAVFGAYNIVDTEAQLVVGAGTADARANVFTCGKTADTDENWITIGNTKITEAQLQRLLSLI